MSQEYGPGGILWLLTLGPIVSPVVTSVPAADVPFGSPWETGFCAAVPRSERRNGLGEGPGGTLRGWGQKGRCRHRKKELQHFLMELPPKMGKDMPPPALSLQCPVIPQIPSMCLRCSQQLFRPSGAEQRPLPPRVPRLANPTCAAIVPLFCS